MEQGHDSACPAKQLLDERTLLELSSLKMLSSKGDTLQPANFPVSETCNAKGKDEECPHAHATKTATPLSTVSSSPPPQTAFSRRIGARTDGEGLDATSSSHITGKHSARHTDTWADPERLRAIESPRARKARRSFFGRDSMVMSMLLEDNDWSMSRLIRALTCAVEAAWHDGVGTKEHMQVRGKGAVFERVRRHARNASVAC
jgi:hypothetical protein